MAEGNHGWTVGVHPACAGMISILASICCSCVDGNGAFDAQVMREVCASGNMDQDGARSGSPVYKPDLEKVKGS